MHFTIYIYIYREREREKQVTMYITEVRAALSPGVKRRGREADHSPPTSTEVKKKCGSIHPLPHKPSWRSV
jgi:hypothetical protein